MPTTANLNNAATTVDTSKDSIIIQDYDHGKRGGATLDTTGFAPSVIPAGHIVIKETATGVYKPMPVSGSAYAALPASHEYMGVVVSSVLTAKPFVAIMTHGIVNKTASVYSPASLITAFNAQVPHISFVAD